MAESGRDLSPRVSPSLPFLGKAVESAILCKVRGMLVRAAHVKIHKLRRLDNRIAAHLDGVAVAGEFGWKLCEAALEKPKVGAVFAATERATEDKC